MSDMWQKSDGLCYYCRDEQLDNDFYCEKCHNYNLWQNLKHNWFVRLVFWVGRPKF